MSERKSVLVVLSAKGGGDRPPVVSLACGLRDRGHRVEVLCDGETADLISSTNLPTTTFPGELDQRGHVKRWIKALQNNGNKSVIDSPNPMIEWAEPLLPSSMDALSAFKPDLIISSLFGIGLAHELSVYSGTPWCFVNPSFYFGENSTRTWEDDWYGPYIPKLAQECFLPLAKQANIVLHATDPEFDILPSALPPSHHYVGFLLWEPPIKNFYGLDEPGDPWALITLSSVRQDDEAILARSALEALEGRAVRTLLTQPDENVRDMLGHIPKNAIIEGFVSHSPVLKKSSLVINHAGHGIVSKAIKYGVPMVVLPWDRDQPGVAERAKRLGLAVVVSREDTTPDKVQQAVAKVFEDPRYRESALFHAERLREIDAVEISCNLLEDF